MIISFGKYKGRDIRSVPDDYIDWMIKSSEQTLKDYRAEQSRREALQDAATTWDQKIIKEGFKSFAMKYHPDHGGSNETMKEINAAYERLKSKADRI